VAKKGNNTGEGKFPRRFFLTSEGSGGEEERGQMGSVNAKDSLGGVTQERSLNSRTELVRLPKPFRGKWEGFIDQLKNQSKHGNNEEGWSCIYSAAKILKEVCGPAT